jgi:hypothetical protein
MSVRRLSRTCEGGSERSSSESIDLVRVRLMKVRVRRCVLDLRFRDGMMSKPRERKISRHDDNNIIMSHL